MGDLCAANIQKIEVKMKIGPKVCIRIPIPVRLINLNIRAF